MWWLTCFPRKRALVATSVRWPVQHQPFLHGIRRGLAPLANYAEPPVEDTTLSEGQPVPTRKGLRNRRTTRGLKMLDPALRPFCTWLLYRHLRPRQRQAVADRARCKGKWADLRVFAVSCRITLLRLNADIQSRTSRELTYCACTRHAAIVLPPYTRKLQCAEG